MVFSTLQPVPQATHNLLTATIARRLTPQPIKLRADIELTCYTPSGIEAIKKALRAGEKSSTEAVPIKAKLVADADLSVLQVSVNTTDGVVTLSGSVSSAEKVAKAKAKRKPKTSASGRASRAKGN